MAEKYKRSRRSLKTREEERQRMLPLREKIVELWNRGWTGTQIGETLGLTKNSVIGYVARARAEGVKIEEKSRAIVNSARFQKAPPGTFDNRQFVFAKSTKKKKDYVVPRPTVIEDEGDVEPVSILDLTLTSCRFIVDGEGYESKFCGRQTHVGRPYCAGHARICYDPVKTRKKVDARVTSM